MSFAFGKLRPRRSVLMMMVLTGVFAFTSVASAQWFKPVADHAKQTSLPISADKELDGWKVTGEYELLDDEATGQSFYRLTKGRGLNFETAQPISSPCEIVAWVRFPDLDERGQTVTLNHGLGMVPGRPEGVVRISATATLRGGNRRLQVSPLVSSVYGRQYQDQMQLVEGSMNKVGAPDRLYFMKRFEDISPVWDPEYRNEIEAAMAAIPSDAERWTELRIVHTPDFLRLYRDGVLLAERRRPAAITAPAGIALGPAVDLAKLEVRKLPKNPEPKYTPVGLDLAVNETSIGKDASLKLAGDALPQGGQTVTVDGKPFTFPRRDTGADHVDVGQSLFHQRNRSGHFMARDTWPDVGKLDPARIRMTAPNQPYNRLWVIAAHDGEELNVPTLTVRFYRPTAGFPIDTEIQAPALTASSASDGAKPLGVKTIDGKDMNLWLIPIDLPGEKIASEMRHEPVLSIEVTKKVHGYRTYPDPANYSWFQGGLPSGVRIFAMTLEKAPLRLTTTGNRHGNVYVSPEQPVWQVELDNLTDKQAAADVELEITDPDGKTQKKSLKATLSPDSSTTLQSALETSVYGLHDVVTTVTVDGGKGGTLTHSGKFVQLPPDDRMSNQRNSHWGLWNWNGGHETNSNLEENHYLNRAAGSRFTRGSRQSRRGFGLAHSPQHLIYGPSKWSMEDEVDEEAKAADVERIVKSAAKKFEENPSTISFSLFTETAVSAKMTYGIPPQYVGEGKYEMNEDEARRFRGFMRTYEAVAKGLREHDPRLPIAFGWCESNFAEPFMEAGVDKELIDWFGVDSPIFERLPEMPIREVTPNRMWLMKKAMADYGYSDIPLVHTESYYPSSHELALGHQRSADHTVRVSVLSLALESDVLANCFTLHDTASYWGSQHYGCIGLVGRKPEFNPKPAFPMYATMTSLIDLEQFDGFLETGSKTAYCVRFRHGSNYTYALWTVRGERPMTVTTNGAGEILFVDSQGNRSPLQVNDKNQATVTVSPTPVWIRATGNGQVAEVSVGKPSYDEAPSGKTLVLDKLDKPWTYNAEAYPKYAENHWGCPRYNGPFVIEAADSKEQGGKVWDINMKDPEVKRELAAWYGVFEPSKPVDVPGKAKALGIWANGNSNWGRVIYEIEDANGEVWQSIGSKDDWNCDDTHCWSYFAHDGWRYLEFPLPQHEPGDDYRGKDTVWWNHDKEGVVDLPVKLKKVIVELRTHNIYVDQLQEVPSEQRGVQLSNLVAVYDNDSDMTSAPVQLQRKARDLLPKPEVKVENLPNPIAGMQESNAEVAPAKIVKVAPPEHQYDGTRVEVSMKPVEGATRYTVYVSAYESGAGAVSMGSSEEPTVLVRRLRPDFPLYLFATYHKDKRTESQPSEGYRVLLKDDFPMK